MAERPTRASWIVFSILLAFLGALIYGLVVWFEAVPFVVKAPLVTGVATVLVAIVTVVGARFLDRRQQLRQSIRERKLPIYEKFVQSVLGAFQSGGVLSDDATEELVGAFNEFSRDLVVWGSDELVTAWSVYLNAWRRADTEPKRVALLLQLEVLLVAIRKECGHKGPLPPGTLLAIFVTDLEEYVAAQTASGNNDRSAE
jgi:hypothetical protein